MIATPGATELGLLTQDCVNDRTLQVCLEQVDEEPVAESIAVQPLCLAAERRMGVREDGPTRDKLPKSRSRRDLPQGICNRMRDGPEGLARLGPARQQPRGPRRGQAHRSGGLTDVAPEQLDRHEHHQAPRRHHLRAALARAHPRCPHAPRFARGLYHHSQVAVPAGSQQRDRRLRSVLQRPCQRASRAVQGAPPSRSGRAPRGIVRPAHSGRRRGRHPHDTPEQLDAHLRGHALVPRFGLGAPALDCAQNHQRSPHPCPTRPRE